MVAKPWPYGQVPTLVAKTYALWGLVPARLLAKGKEPVPSCSWRSAKS